MEITPQMYIYKMTENAIKKKSLLEGLLERTRQQSVFLTEDGMEKLQEIINEKQGLINRINELDEEFASCFSQLKIGLKVDSLEHLGDNPGIKGLAELKGAVKAVQDLISEIHSLEQSNSKKAKELLNNLGKEVKKVNEGKRIANAYKQTPSLGTSYFIDKKK